MTQTSKPFSILVGIDYSTASELALDRAFEVATGHPNAELHVVHVVPTIDAHIGENQAIIQTSDPRLPDPRAYEKLQAYVAARFRAFEKRALGALNRPLRVVTHLRFQSPALELAQLAHELEADLVIVGMYGRGSITRFFLGSATESDTRLALCRVLMFRPNGLPPKYAQSERDSSQYADGQIST